MNDPTKAPRLRRYVVRMSRTVYATVYVDATSADEAKEKADFDDGSSCFEREDAVIDLQEIHP